MPVKKDASGRRSVEVETEVPGTPEEVWRAIASGPGISAWFVPTKLEEREGGAIVLDFGPGMESQAVIKVWDPPRRFVAEGEMGPGSPTVADEWTVEAKSGGTCRVRVVHSWFASTDDWDNQFEGVEKGWPAFFRILKIYLAQDVGVVDADRHLGLVHQIVPHRLAAEVFHFPALAPVSVHGLDRDAIVVALVERELQRPLHRIELLRADDGDDQFHALPRAAVPRRYRW